MLTDETKKRIESLDLKEMEYEINLGHRSRFQKEKFAYLQTCYNERMRDKIAYRKDDQVDYDPNRPHIAISKKTESTPTPNPTETKQIERFSLVRVVEGVAIFIIGVCIVWGLWHYFSVNLNVPNN